MRQIIAHKYKRFVWYIEIVLALLTLFLIYNYLPIGGEKRTFYLSSSTAEGVVKALKEEGYSVTPLDKMVLRLIHTPPKGWYTLDPDKQGRFLFFEQMYKQRNHRIMTLIIYPGETRDELIERLAHDTKLEKQKLQKRYAKLARHKEGDIIAGSYPVARDADANATIDYLFLASNERLHRFWETHHKQNIDPLEETVLFKVASIIQKESNVPTEMPFISSVIYNRIEKGMKLQMDSTLNYGPYAHKIITPERIQSDTSDYNTYKHKGLPPHPLSTFTIEALEAALHPAETDYLFFMLTPEGGHHFSESYEEHLASIKKFRAYQKSKKRVHRKTKHIPEPSPKKKSSHKKNERSN